MALPGGGNGRVLATDLLQRAETLLRVRADEAAKQNATQDSSRELVAAVLRSTIEVAEEDPHEDNMDELKVAIAGAQRLNVVPELRVQGNRVLHRWNLTSRKTKSSTSEVERLTRKLADITEKLTSRSEGDSISQPASGSTTDAWRPASNLRQQQEALVAQLRRALDEAQHTGMPESTKQAAIELIKRVEKERRVDATVAKKMEGLLTLNDASKLEEVLLDQKESALAPGTAARKVLNEVAGRVMRLAEQEQLQTWLLKELSEAADQGDLMRLKQLMIQAHSMQLTVPPQIVSLVDRMEAESRDPAHSSTMSFRSSKSDPKERSSAFQARRRDFLHNAVKEAEKNPNAKNLDAAQKALAEAKQTRASEDVLAAMEKQYKRLESLHRPRLKVEDELQKLLDLAEEVSFGTVTEEVLKQDAQVRDLSMALAEGKKWKADEDLLEDADDLLQRSMEVQQLRRSAEEKLRNTLSRTRRDDQELEQLQAAVADCKRLGMITLKAERQLLRLREGQVNREAAEAELTEACKGFGEKGRERLEAAVRSAKGAGVSAEKLRAASKRVTELAEHEQRCTVLAGEFQRTMPVLGKEPWRYQQLVEAAQELKPWTPKLESLIQRGQEILKKDQDEQHKLREAHGNLASQLKKIEECRATGKSVHELMAGMEKILAQAKSAGVSEELRREGEQQVKNYRREGCQRSVAEHRLRLALNNRDHVEIERSMRQVRALGQVGLSDQSLDRNAASTARRDQQPNSARLMDAAGNMLRHLTETAARRQAAAASLQQRVSDGEADAMASTWGGPAATPRDDVGKLEASNAWLKEAKEAVLEAKQSGVVPTLVEQAKFKIRAKRRERQDQQEAMMSLKKVLSKKDVPEQVLLAKMRRVQRLQAGDLD
mmetsp:Transcript_93544/g.166413  ORF Transcript_93544/g.166413 Transcript_93544/m.166413 type:complete len:887 (+) Transcript_93544:81-2741(+)